MLSDQMSDPIKPDQVDFSPVILDVNALMAPFQFGINLDTELKNVVPERKPIVPLSVIKEIEMLMKKKNSWKIKAALDLALKYPIIDIKGKGDSPIFNLAVNMKWPVVTNDRRLRNKLNERGVPVIFLRERGHLEISGF